MEGTKRPDSLQRLAKSIRELEDKVSLCSRCGMCQSVCPLFAETGREADVASGRLSILEGIMGDIFDDPEGAAQRLDRCLLCGSCMAVCPNHVPVLEIFLKARAAIAEVMGLPWFKRTLLRGFLARPEAFDKLASYGAFFQKALFTRNDPFHNASCAGLSAIITPGALASRHIKNPAKIPFHRRFENLNTQGEKGVKAAFFTGCLTDKVFPGVGESFLHVMEKNGLGVFMPQGQGCCGIPALASGDLETFLGLMVLHLELFEGEEFGSLVTPCATCTFTIKKLWPLFAENAGEEIQAKAQALAAKTMDASEFLVRKGKIMAAVETGQEKYPESSEFPESSESSGCVTIHDPCHLKKSLGISEEPRLLLSRYSGMEIREMEGADECCGMGGSFTLGHYSLSEKIGEKKAERIAATGCETVAVSCPACMMQIIDMLSRRGIGVKVEHPLEIYARALGFDPALEDIP